MSVLGDIAAGLEVEAAGGATAVKPAFVLAVSSAELSFQWTFANWRVPVPLKFDALIQYSACVARYWLPDDM